MNFSNNIATYSGKPEDIEKYIDATILLFPDCEELHCSNIGLTTLPKNIGHFKVINCSRNKLTTLDDVIYTNTVEINCSHNNIEYIYAMFPKLIILDCSFNPVGIISAKLEELYASHCPRLQILNDHLFEKMRIMDISYNSKITALPNMPNITILGTYYTNIQSFHMYKTLIVLFCNSNWNALGFIIDNEELKIYHNHFGRLTNPADKKTILEMLTT